MLLVTALSVVGITNSAFAADGVITINGKVINGTCTLTGSAGATGTANNVTVQLDTVRNTAFGAANSTTGEKDFTLTVTDGVGGTCDALTVGAVKNITLSGTAGTNYDVTNTSWLINTDTSAPTTKDVFVQILNVDGKSKLFIVDTEGKKYKAVITSENENTLAFLKAGETIHIRYIEMNDVNVIKSVGE